MNDRSKPNKEHSENLPSPELTAELLSKASKVTSWLSALKLQSKSRQFVGASEDGRVQIMIRDYRIARITTDESFEQASAQEIMSHLCEAHNDAIEKMKTWSACQCAALAKAVGITGDFELPF